MIIHKNVILNVHLSVHFNVHIKMQDVVEAEVANNKEEKHKEGNNPKLMRSDLQSKATGSKNLLRWDNTSARKLITT